MAKETEKATEHIGVSCSPAQKQKIMERFHKEKTKSKRYNLSLSAWITETLTKGEANEKSRSGSGGSS